MLPIEDVQPDLTDDPPEKEAAVPAPPNRRLRRAGKKHAGASRRSAISAKPATPQHVTFKLPAVDDPAARVGEAVFAKDGKGRLKKVGRLTGYLATEGKSDQFEALAKVAFGTELFVRTPDVEEA